MSKIFASTSWLGAIWEELAPAQVHLLQVQQVQAYKRSAFQEVALVEHSYFGQGLVLDGVAQYWAIDEWVYHEQLAAVPLLFHANPQRVLILGGGDGLALREVLRDQHVSSVVLVDIDGAVVDLCHEYHAELHQGSFDDPRTTVIIGDALAYLQSTTSCFDVVIIDLVDALESDALALYHACLERLESVIMPDSIVVGHGCSTTPLDSGLVIWSLLEHYFPHTAFYQAYIHSWAASWGFILASPTCDFMQTSAIELETALGYRSQPLRSVDLRSFPGCFYQSPYVLGRKAAKTTRMLEGFEINE